jgi:hypothetical protein
VREPPTYYWTEKMHNNARSGIVCSNNKQLKLVDKSLVQGVNIDASLWESF